MVITLIFGSFDLLDVTLLEVGCAFGFRFRSRRRKCERFAFRFIPEKTVSETGSP
jgi:hypothetical protein